MATISNSVFLRAIFRADWRGALVASFGGDPGAPPRGAWTVSHAGSFFPEDAAANNYVCISTFHASHDGRPRRRKDLHQRTHVIVLDDVGEKLLADEVRARVGPPSYRLRTSPGSEQWGYILAAPEPDAARVDALLDGLVKAGLNPSGTDPGMKGVTRLVRLPVGRNGKAKYGPNGAACVLLAWAPERRFTVDQLAIALGIDLTNGEPAAKPKPRSRASGPDPVLDLLTDLGLVKSAIGAGHSDITCPFVDEHTGGETGTAYLSGGGFKCHHGHCQDRTTGDFLERLNEMARAAGVPSLAVREFAMSDQAALERLREHFAGRHSLSTLDVEALVLVPKSAIDHEIQAAELFHGADIRTVQAVRSRLARKRSMKVPSGRQRWTGRVAALPPGYQRPVPLAEAQAAQTAIVAAFFANMPIQARAPMSRAGRATRS